MPKYRYFLWSTIEDRGSGPHRAKDLHACPEDCDIHLFIDRIWHGPVTFEMVKEQAKQERITEAVKFLQESGYAVAMGADVTGFGRPEMVADQQIGGK